MVKESACNEGDLGLIPVSGRSFGEGNGYPLQYSCLENPMDREAWGTTVYGVIKESYTPEQLRHTHTHTHSLFRSLLQGHAPMLQLLRMW